MSAHPSPHAHHRHTAAGEAHVRAERLALGAGFTLALLVLLFFAWLAEQMLRGNTAAFDQAVRAAVHSCASDGLTAAMKLVTLFGSSLVLVPIGILSLVFFYARREHHIFRTLAASFAGALVLEVVLKLAFHRQRPVPFFDLPVPKSYSFPSGHALVSLCVYSALAMVLATQVPRGAARAAIWIAAAALVLTIGFSRIYLGVHYPSDVLAGYAAGIVWLSAIHFVDTLHFRYIRREQQPARQAPAHRR